VVDADLERKLTAIFYADVAGYSRLTGLDEAGTHRRLSRDLDYMTSTIESAGGRVVHLAGDAVLADFGSVVRALDCAIQIQDELQARNAEVEADRRLAFRIGINLGEVIVDRNEIYGDGVNVAARLESLAPPGGICISASVHDQVHDRTDVTYEDMGEQAVKNSERPVRCYRVRRADEAAIPTGGGRSRRLAGGLVAAALVLALAAGAAWWWRQGPGTDTASETRMALPLPDKPSIAVLPFANISGDPKDAYFVDGMTDDLITDLSRISGLFVIARNSVFTYKGRAVKIQQVAEELGVRYVLEGSLRKAGDQVRINAQLIDAMSGTHLWAERYDRKLDDIFQLQDEVVGKIVAALAVELTAADLARGNARKGTDDMVAYDKMLRGLELRSRFKWKDFAASRALFRDAIKRDPGFARAYTELGNFHYQSWRIWGEPKQKNLEKAVVFAEQAAALDPSGAHSQVVMALAQKFLGKHREAEAAAQKAVALNPMHAGTLAALADYLRLSGEPKEAIELLQKAMRLDPYFPAWYLAWLGHAYFMTGQYDKAIPTLRRGIERDASYVAFHLFLAASYAGKGDEAAAKKAGAEVLKLAPGFTLARYKNFIGHKDKADLERDLKALRIAGLPE